MKELDLHGLTYEQAEIKVEDYILVNDPPYDIITGNSFRMKEIVEHYISKYDLQSHYLKNNFGCLTITDKI